MGYCPEPCPAVACFFNRGKDFAVGLGGTPETPSSQSRPPRIGRGLTGGEIGEKNELYDKLIFYTGMLSQIETNR